MYGYYKHVQKKRFDLDTIVQFRPNYIQNGKISPFLIFFLSLKKFQRLMECFQKWPLHWNNPWSTSRKSLKIPAGIWKKQRISKNLSTVLEKPSKNSKDHPWWNFLTNNPTNFQQIPLAKIVLYILYEAAVNMGFLECMNENG